MHRRTVLATLLGAFGSACGGGDGGASVSPIPAPAPTPAPAPAPSSDPTPGIAYFRRGDSSVPLGVDRAGNLVTMSAPKPFAISPVAPFVLRKFNSNGDQLKYGPLDELTLPEMPTDAAMDAAGNLYLAYARFERPYLSRVVGDPPTTSELYRISPEGAVSLLYRGASGESDFVSPIVIAVDDTGSLFFGDTVTNTIRRLQAGGGTIQVGRGDFNRYGPNTLAVSTAGSIFLGVGNSVARLNPDGAASVIAGTPAYTPTPAAADGIGASAKFWSSVLTLVSAPDGNLYVGDYTTIRLVTPAGEVRTLAGRTGLQTEESWKLMVNHPGFRGGLLV